jgi:hypothetical protein
MGYEAKIQLADYDYIIESDSLQSLTNSGHWKEVSENIQNI